MLRKKRYKILLGILIILPVNVTAELFGYEENERDNLSLFPQWLSVLERNLKENSPEGSCKEQSMNRCHLKNWMTFIDSIRYLKKELQLEKVNSYANQQAYILDIENYGLEDYWATPMEFLYNNGDCEDYAIIKMMSLKMLGFDMHRTRLVVLQDTNLRIAHAILVVETENDTVILDNQVDEIISHKYILHYVPIYALNENKWWLYLPK